MNRLPVRFTLKSLNQTGLLVRPVYWFVFFKSTDPIAVFNLPSSGNILRLPPLARAPLPPACHHPLSGELPSAGQLHHRSATKLPGRIPWPSAIFHPTILPPVLDLLASRSSPASYPPHRRSLPSQPMSSSSPTSPIAAPSSRSPSSASATSGSSSPAPSPARPTPSPAPSYLPHRLRRDLFLRPLGVISNLPPPANTQSLHQTISCGSLHPLLNPTAAGYPHHLHLQCRFLR